VKGPRHELDFEGTFSKENALKRWKAKKSDEDACTRALLQIPSGFEHEIDYTKYHPAAVYHVFSNQRVKLLSDMGKHESLFNSFKKHFATQYDPKENLGFTLSQGFCDHMTLEQMDLLATLHAKIREDEVYIGCYF
jgi:hypothetical protein